MAKTMSLEPATNLFEPPTVSSTKRRGMRLWRVEVLNWGTLGEDIVHVADLQGGWLCITGRNGTGKSTLADAIVTAFPPANARIHYNAAGGAKNTKERTRLTYLRGVYGHEQDDTGRARPSTLRSKPGSLTAILLQFHEESSERWVTLLVLGTFNAALDEQWLYGVLEGKADLSVVQGKEDWETRAKRLRKADWGLTADTGPYRERLRHLLRIPSDKAITTFVRTVGLKDIGDVNGFIRGNMLDEVSVHQRYTDLTKHYEKQLEIDAEIETTRQMISLLKPLGELVPHLASLKTELDLKEAAEAAVQWRINAERVEVLERLREARKAELSAVEAVIKSAEGVVKDQEALIKAIEASEPAKRAAALHAQSESLRLKRLEVESRLNELRAALLLIGGNVPTSEVGFQEMRQKLDALVKNADTNEEQRGKSLFEKNGLVDALSKKRDGLSEEIDAAIRSSSHLPPEDLKRRDTIAEAVGLRSTDLPYLGELVDVDPYQQEWRVALEKLLRTQARRMLIPSEHFGKVAAYVNATDFRARVRMERVYLKAPRQTMSIVDTRCAYAKLRVKPGAVFADWLTHVFRNRFDHVCCKTVQDYEAHIGTALTRDGLVKDRSDYHEKRDDIYIRGSRDHFLGWNNEDKIRELRAEMDDLDKQIRTAVLAVSNQRSSNASTKEKRDFASVVLKQLPAFDLIDMVAVNGALAQLDNDRESFAKIDPEAAQVEQRLSKANSERDKAQKCAKESGSKSGGIKGEIKNLEVDLADMKSWRSERSTPSEIDAVHVGVFFNIPVPDNQRAFETWEKSVQKKCEMHFGEIKDKCHQAEMSINAVMTKYLTMFPKETKDLSASIDAAEAFLDRLKFLEGERLGELQDRFRDYLKKNLALHVSQLKSELEGQVSDAEDRIEQINRILTQIPWDGSKIISIQPRPNPQVEIKMFRDLLTKASAPLFQPTEDQSTAAFAAVKEIFASLAVENVRKLVLDARQWRLFTVELRDTSVEISAGQRKPSFQNTDGLSGGQKNKLSVTLLASALAFQYDLAGTRQVPGTFRTVIIDEAFARLDSENARYALELFKRFDFQLVLVHPLDGTVRVAEDYVHAFLLATIRDDQHTTLTGVRIEGFRELVARAEAEKALEGGASSKLESAT